MHTPPRPSPQPDPIDAVRPLPDDRRAPRGGVSDAALRLAEAAPEARGALLEELLEQPGRIDLRGAPLEGLDLRGLELRPGRPTRRRGARGPDLLPAPVVLDGARFAGATLSGARLAGVSLRNAVLDGALLVGADLRGADLSGASLRGVHLTGADLSQADLSFADLRGAALLTSRLGDATLVGADLRDSLLQSADLRRAQLREADLRWSQLDGANLTGANLCAARIGGASLTLANLSGARLSDRTDLAYAFLHGARFERSGLHRGHLGAGIGEDFTDLARARTTYRRLRRCFELEGEDEDARWAHRRARRTETAMHRPDRARRYFPRPAAAPRGAPPPALRRAAGLCRWATGLCARLEGTARQLRHLSIWLSGLLLGWTTGYGTSFPRLVGVLVATWLGAAAVYARGGVYSFDGRTGSAWREALSFSAAALTPIDAFPLIAQGSVARVVAGVEGVIGMVLFGALGYVAASRWMRD